DDESANGVVRRIDAHRALADIDQRSKVRLVELVLPQEFDRGAAQIFERIAARQVAELAGVEESLDVLAKTKDRGGAVSTLVRANPFESSEPVVQRVRKNMNLCVVPIDELSVHPDLGDLLDHDRNLLTEFASWVPRLDPFVTLAGRGAHERLQRRS